MPTEITLVSAFLVGLLGSSHCLGMCGGIVGALTLGVDEKLRTSPARLFPYLAAYNIGRIASYALAGAVLGLAGAGALGLLPPETARLVARLVSGGFMVLLGLFLAGWWPAALGVLEQAGGALWRRLEPIGRRFLPVNHPLKALAAGLVWGWLPCGLVYAALAWSASTGSAAQGALLMFFFGLGTLPMLLAIGTATGIFRRIVIQPWVRRGAGVLILLFGVYTLAAPGGHAGHDRAAHQSMPQEGQ
ncbi:MAG: sulfite exporter TauE/SafE family protein [Gammaproteobacteria bacterium]|nr:sulfite exporter TauE/SafE family protein [Gammaproteobacteria bacterium]